MRSLLSMRWRDLLFAHWPVAPETVEQAVPDRLSVDTYDGEAYLGIVPFVMSDIRPRGAPIGLGFNELNLRTYVTVDGEPGVYFFNLDADDRIGVRLARSLFKLPYYRAAMTVETEGRGESRELTFRSRRTTAGVAPARFDADYGRSGAFSEPASGSVEEFLTERYRFYAATDGGRIYYGDIGHDPWRLAPAWAEIRDNTLFRANDFEHPGSEPLLHFAAPIGVAAGRVHRI